MSELRVELGTSGTECVSVAVVGRAHPAGLGRLDHGWLLAEIEATGSPAGFRGDAFLRAGDFSRFAAQLAELEAGDRTCAELWPRDPWVAVVVVGGIGAPASVSVRARDGGSERAVAFEYPADAEALARLRTQVAAIAQRYATGAKAGPS